MSFSIIIPMYNESSLCEKTAQELLSAFSDAFPKEPFELIFSDDGSTDDSAEKIARLAAGDARVRLVRAPRNMGKGAAVRRGMLAATGDDMLFTDCDLAYGTAQPVALLRFHRKSGASLGRRSRVHLFSDAFLMLRDILRAKKAVRAAKNEPRQAPRA